MFNSRQGHSLTAPDYGLPDLTSLVRGSRESVSELEEALRQCIERYEPRLTDVTVSNVLSEEDPFHMKFKITARLVVGNRESGVWYETSIGPEGRVEVRG